MKKLFPVFRQKARALALSSEKLSWTLLSIAFLAGVVLRIRMYFIDRSLWHDTASLANSVIKMDYFGLLGPLDGNQSAPVGFLVVSKFLGSLFGYSELSLLLFPLLLGVGALVVHLFLSVEVLGILKAPLAFLPFAFCSTAIYYSGEFKQYSSDLFFAELVLFVAIRLYKSKFADKYVYLYFACCLVGMVFSHAVVFVIAGTSVVLVWSLFYGRAGMCWRKFCGGLAILLPSFVLLYVFQMRPAAHASFYSYWAYGFPPRTSLWSLFAWLFETIINYPVYPMGFDEYSAYIVVLAMVGGVVSSLRVKRERVTTWLLLLPLLALFLAAALHLYPITTGRYDINSRTVLFTLPFTFVFMANGVAACANLFSSQIFYCLAIGALLTCASVNKITPFPEFMRQEMRPLMEVLRQHFSPGDSIYVYQMAIPAFDYYTRDNPLSCFRGSTRVPSDLLNELSKVAYGKRNWTIVSHDYSDHHKIIGEFLRAKHGIVHEIEFPGAWLLLSYNDQKSQ